MTDGLKILMAAAENDAIPGAKVGGVADVVRDLPPALAARGCQISVVVPSYGVLHQRCDSSRLCDVDLDFRGSSTRLSLWRLAIPGSVRQLVLHSASFAPAIPGQIYCNDPPQRPFATDANKFALFSAGVCAAASAGAFGELDVLHLHDWHTALVALLRAADPAHAALQRVRCVLTIHNLALQGIRPLRGEPSALESWFPELDYDEDTVRDPRWSDCVNPMAIGIRLADAVNTVSPTYASEILRPNAVEEAGFHGGEGLDADLATVHGKGQLHGILNGCEYPDEATSPRLPWPRLRARLAQDILTLAAGSATLASAHFLAATRLAALGQDRPRMLVTSVGRIVEQKLGLLRQPLQRGQSALDALLEILGDDGLFVLLGSGDESLEQFLRETAARHANFLFIRGFVGSLAPALYREGDLFLMPSSYEPCGISQMLAMRDGQPCLVHAVGGLRDTVTHGVNGFSFEGESRAMQARNLVRTFCEAHSLHARESAAFERVRKAAAESRFGWADSAGAYLQHLYTGA